ncbi:MAG TPA: hypothetical protein VGM20_00600 [Gemmatimonadales bacterium]|jgi:uncharacterized cupredoxin-like copper-binding protein
MMHNETMGALVTIRSVLFAILAVTTAAPLAAQVPKPPAGSAASQPAPATPVTITFTEYAFDAPATVPAGMVTFRAANKGKELHHATLVKLDKGHTVAELVAALQAKAPPPAWMTWYGGPQNASTVTINLPEGDYAWVCLIPGPDGVPHFIKGMTRAMKVLPSKTITPAPKADITVSMADYAWTFSKPITRGKHVIQVLNVQGAQPHEFVVVRLAAGKTANDVLTWVQHAVGKPPLISVEGTAPMQAGLTNYTTVDFAPGHYALFCFVPDAKDGKSHAEHGMVKEFTVQ